MVRIVQTYRKTRVVRGDIPVPVMGGVCLAFMSGDARNRVKAIYLG